MKPEVTPYRWGEKCWIVCVPNDGCARYCGVPVMVFIDEARAKEYIKFYNSPQFSNDPDYDAYIVEGMVDSGLDDKKELLESFFNGGVR